MGKKRLYQFTENKKLILVSFFITNPFSVYKIHKQWEERDNEHKSCKGRSEKVTRNSNFKKFGGMIGFINPDNLKKGFLMTFKCPIVAGLCFMNNRLYISSNSTIKVIRKGRLEKEIKNNLFNDLHGISRFGKNFLIASTGIDSLLEINPLSESIEWHWFSTENGFNISAEGNKRKIIKDFSYDKILTATP